MTQEAFRPTHLKQPSTCSEKSNKELKFSAFYIVILPSFYGLIEKPFSIKKLAVDKKPRLGFVKRKSKVMSSFLGFLVFFSGNSLETKYKAVNKLLSEGRLKLLNEMAFIYVKCFEGLPDLKKKQCLCLNFSCGFLFLFKINFQFSSPNFQQ